MAFPHQHYGMNQLEKGFCDTVDWSHRRLLTNSKMGAPSYWHLPEERKGAGMFCKHGIRLCMHSHCHGYCHSFLLPSLHPVPPLLPHSQIIPPEPVSLPGTQLPRLLFLCGGAQKWPWLVYATRPQQLIDDSGTVSLPSII